MNEELKLLQCPFCGYSAHKATLRNFLFFGRKQYYIECNWCFASTDCQKTEIEAIIAWNARA